MLWYSIQKNNVIYISTDFDHQKINNDEVRAKRRRNQIEIPIVAASELGRGQTRCLHLGL